MTNIDLEKAGLPASEHAGGLMVCVTGQHSCERLLELGSRVRRSGQRMYCVHCVQTGHNFLNNIYEPLAIEFLFTCSSLYDAELTILRANNVVDALVEFAQTNRVSKIVLGPSPVKGEGSFSAKLAARLPDVEFVVSE